MGGLWGAPERGMAAPSAHGPPGARAAAQKPAGLPVPTIHRCHFVYPEQGQIATPATPQHSRIASLIDATDTKRKLWMSSTFYDAVAWHDFDISGFVFRFQ